MQSLWIYKNWRVHSKEYLRLRFACTDNLIDILFRKRLTIIIALIGCMSPAMEMFHRYETRAKFQSNPIPLEM